MIVWYLLPLIFIIEFALLYILSRYSINNLFWLLRRFVKNDRRVLTIISAIFLPGTIIHELSHFFVAMALGLRVRQLSFFPQWEKDYLKLGGVVYEKKDAFRSIVVGIAPFFVGLVMFWWLSQLSYLLNGQALTVRLFRAYLIFVISTTMFASKKDLLDIIYLLPAICVAVVVIFLFPDGFLPILRELAVLISGLDDFFYAILIYVFISISIHGIFLCLILLYKFLLRS